MCVVAVKHSNRPHAMHACRSFEFVAPSPTAAAAVAQRVAATTNESHDGSSNGR